MPAIPRDLFQLLLRRTHAMGMSGERGEGRGTKGNGHPGRPELSGRDRKASSVIVGFSVEPISSTGGHPWRKCP